MSHVGNTQLSFSIAFIAREAQDQSFVHWERPISSSVLQYADDIDSFGGLLLGGIFLPLFRIS